MGPGLAAAMCSPVTTEGLAALVVCVDGWRVPVRFKCSKSKLWDSEKSGLAKKGVSREAEVNAYATAEVNAYATVEPPCSS